jgi:hypothetical protein
MLESFEAAPRPIFYVRDFEKLDLLHDDARFVFHMGILADQGLVERDDRKPGFGLQRGADGSAAWSMVPLRLTAQGHDFIEALKDKEVWATLKRDFKDASISTLWSVSKKGGRRLCEEKNRSDFERRGYTHRLTRRQR